MGDKQDSTPGQDPIASAKLDKLHLEIENLRKKNKWELLSPLIPLLASGVTVIALVLGFLQFQSQQHLEQNKLITEQQLERTNRLQTQVRSDIDEILKFTEDKSQTLSRVSFLLEDLNTIMASQINESQKGSDVFAGYEQTFTKSLVKQISDDTDFNKNPREVAFATTVMESWSDYGGYLKKHVNTLNFILSKYVAAILNLRDKNPSYLQEMKYEKETDSYIVLPKFDKREGAENLYQNFLDIRDGFTQHVKIIADDPRPEVKALQDQNLLNFAAALCNKEIAKQILGKTVDTPCEK